MITGKVKFTTMHQQFSLETREEIKACKTIKRQKIQRERNQNKKYREQTTNEIDEHKYSRRDEEEKCALHKLPSKAILLNICLDGASRELLDTVIS